MVIFSRRDFLRTTTALGLAGTALPDAFSAETASDSPRLRRKFTACLSCGAIGVGADQREAIRLAHRFGFESVEPAADFLARLADAELQELLAGMKAKKLVWGASGLSVDFRGSDAAFQKGMKDLPRTAQGLKRAGVTRVATWL